MPFLGDLPIVGPLFRSDSRTRTKSNLMVFLRPMVIRSQEDSNALSMDRYDLIRAAQQAVGQPRQSVVMPINEAPVAPALPAPAPGSPFRNGTVPPPLSWPDPADPAPHRAPAAARRRRRRPPLRACRAGSDTLAHAWARATPCPTPSPRRTRCCSRTTARSWCCGRAETAPRGALSEVLRLFDVDAFEREPASTLAKRIAVAYAGGESSAATVVGEVESAVDLTALMQDLPAVEDLLEASNDAPIIRMLNALLTQAAKDGASDIHIEPYERSSAVRFRVDGTLREVVQPNRALHAALISRLKIMAELDIAEKRLPQDGRISLRIGGRAIDVRVSTLPSAHGERAVLRLLDKSESKLHARRPGHERRRAARPSTGWCTSRTASCSSPGPPARARRPRCTRRWAASTPAAPTC